MTARGLFLLGLLTFALSMARHAPTWNFIPDIGMESDVSTRFQGRLQRTWDEYGFLALGGKPIFQFAPSDTVDGVLYLNHPPLAHWIYRAPVTLFGRGIGVLRATASFFASLFSAILVVFIAGHLGRLAGIAALLFCLSSPMLLFYGQMANYESPLLFMMIGLLVAGMSRKKSAVWMMVILAYCAVLTDWAAVFVIPGLWFLAPKELRIRRMLLTSIVMGLGILSFLALIWVWKDSEPVAVLKSAFSAAQSNDRKWPDDAWTRPIAALYRNYGIIPLLAFLLSWPRIFGCWRRGELTRVDQLQIAFTIVGLLNVIAFSSRAYNHEFWWIYFLPALACAFSSLILWINRKNRILVYALFLGLFVHLAWAHKENLKVTRSGLAAPLISLVNELFDEDSLLVFPEYNSHWAHNAHAWVWDDANDAEAVKKVFEQFMAGEIRRNRLVFAFEKHTEEDMKQGIEIAKKNGGTILKRNGYVFLVFER